MRGHSQPRTALSPVECGCLCRRKAPFYGAAGDDAEIGARLLEHVRLDVRLLGGRFGVAHLLRPLGERVLEEALRTNALTKLLPCLFPKT